MSITNLIKSSLYSLKSHKLRVFLTMIGIIIGISSVVTILSIGNGLKAKVNQSSEDTNANKITVYFQYDNSMMSSELVEAFDKRDIEDIKDIKGVEDAQASEGGFMGMSITSGEASYFNKRTSLFIQYYEDTQLNILAGKGFSSKDEKGRKIILNWESAKELFAKPEEAIGKGLEVNGLIYEVVGVLEQPGQFSLTIDSCYLPKSMKNELSGNEVINSLDVTIETGKDKEAVFKDINELLTRNHASIEGSYAMEDPEQVTKVLETIIGGITAFIAFVTGISLFVGGIGVMNIMYVSVSERKREIGIRRAIGAKPRSILLQFLFEAILVTGMGGMIGIVFGYLFGKLAGVFLPFEPVLTVSSFMGATLTSVIVGIIFGIIPAYNASKLDPIKAIYK